MLQPDARGNELGTILFITHDLSLAYYISEQAIILYRGRIAEMGRTATIFDTPLHPYTKMLMASVPRLDKKWEKVELRLAAKQAEHTDGCVYYDRCPLAEARCAKKNPPLAEVACDHAVACFRAGELSSACHQSVYAVDELPNLQG